MKKLIPAALLLAACSDVTTSRGVHVSTDQTAYAAFRPDQVVAVRYTVTNTTSAPVGLPACGDRIMARVWRLDGGTWTSFGGLGCADLLSSPIMLAPSASVTDSVEVTGFGTWRVGVPYAVRGGDVREAVSGVVVTRVPPD